MLFHGEKSALLAMSTQLAGTLQMKAVTELEKSTTQVLRKYYTGLGNRRFGKSARGPA